MRDELYLDGILVELTEKSSIVLNRSVGTPSDISAIMTGSSYTVHLKKSGHNIQSLGYSAFENVDTDYPHIEHTAKLVRNGVTLFSEGKATLQAIGEDIEIRLQWGTIPFLEQLKNTKMNELNISDVVRWDTDAMNDTGIDWVKWCDMFTDAPYYARHAYTLRPAVHVMTLFDSILNNYSLSDRYRSFLNKLWILLPTTKGNRELTEKIKFKITGSYAYENSDTWSSDLLKKGTYEIEPGGYELHYESPTRGSNETPYMYDWITIPKSGLYELTGSITANIGNWTLNIMRSRTVEEDGTATMELVNEDSSFSIYSNSFSFDSPFQMDLSEGDTIFFELRRDDSQDALIAVNLDVKYIIQSKQNYEEVGYLMDYPIKENLPDISCLDFVKACLGVFGLMLENKNSVINMFAVDDVILNKENAIDITDILVNKKKKRIEYSYGLTKYNLLKYSNDDLVPKELGEKTFSADTYNTEEKIVFESPFTSSQENIPMFTWDLESKKYNVNKSSSPRLLVMNGTHEAHIFQKSYENSSSPFLSDGGRIRARANTITVPSLTFSGLEYDTLSSVYWQGYMGVFSQKPRISKREAKLPVDFIQNLTFERPLYADGNYYMLLSVKNYKITGVADLELALLDGVEITEMPSEILKADTFVPLKFNTLDFALYRASDSPVNGKMIRELDELEELPEDLSTSYAAVDTGEGEAKKISLALISGGLWRYQEATEDRGDYIYSTYDSVIAKTNGYLQIGTKRFTEDTTQNAVVFSSADGSPAHLLSKGSLAAFIEGDYDFERPLAGYDAIGLARFDSQYFSVTEGLVSLISSGGKEYTAGSGINLSGTNNDTINVTFGTTASSAARGNDSRINNGQTAYNLLNGSGSWWGQAMSGGSVSGEMTGVTNINGLVYWYNNNIGIGVSSPAQKLHVAGTILATQSIAAFADGNYNIESPLASYNSVGLARFNNSQFVVTNGYVSLLGGSGGSVAWDDITGKPSWITTTKPTYTWDEITSKPSGLVTSVSISGSGNALINASFSGGVLTLTKGTISSGGGAISTVYYYANTSSAEQTYTSGIAPKVGYKLFTGSIAAGEFTTIYVWEIVAYDPTTLSFVCSQESAGDSYKLIVSSGRDTSNNCWVVRLYNPTSAAISINNVRIRYIAFQKL